MRILTGLILVVIGFFYTKYHDKIAKEVGTFGFSNTFLGPGSEYKLHMIIGVAFIIIGILWTTGTFQALLYNTIGNLFGGIGTNTQPVGPALFIHF